MRRAVEIQNTAFKSFCGRISRNMTESDVISEMLSCQREAGANEIGMVLSTTHPTGAFRRSDFGPFDAAGRSAMVRRRRDLQRLHLRLRHSHRLG